MGAFANHNHIKGNIQGRDSCLQRFDAYKSNGSKHDLDSQTRTETPEIVVVVFFVLRHMYRSFSMSFRFVISKNACSYPSSNRGSKSLLSRGANGRISQRESVLPFVPHFIFQRFGVQNRPFGSFFPADLVVVCSVATSEH